MKIFTGLLLAVLVLVSGWACVASEGKMRVITEDNPPYNFPDERGNITGQSTEIVRSLISKTGSDASIELMPWSRGYDIVQNQPNTMLYSTGRMPFREEMFKWVGPIGFADEWFYAKRGSNIKVTSLDDAKKVKSIAVYRDDSNQL